MAKKKSPKKKSPKKTPPSTVYLMLSAVLVVLVSTALPVMPGSSGGGRVYALCIAVFVIALFSPSPMGWLITLLVLGGSLGLP